MYISVSSLCAYISLLVHIYHPLGVPISLSLCTYLSAPPCLSLFSLYISIIPSVYLSLCTFLSSPLCLSVSSLCPYISSPLCISLSLYLSLSPSMYLLYLFSWWIHLSQSLYVSLSISLYFSLSPFKSSHFPYSISLFSSFTFSCQTNFRVIRGREEWITLESNRSESQQIGVI